MAGAADRPEPTRAAAQARIAAVRPRDYAATRNHLDGAVSGLSPYITHGIVDLPEVLAGVAAGHRLTLQHKFVFELGWREYFLDVWRQRGDAILASLHEGVLPDAAYTRDLPADVREARTGVPAIDSAVRTLYATGLLHNHARMWLASYLVHLRKLHWRAGADWMLGHLLDGDLASNHLSWQWVAGTGSHKPYLFNAENVARFAPPDWHSPGTAIDVSYEALDAIARSPRAIAPARGGDGVGTVEPARESTPPAQLGCTAPDAEAVRGRDVWLVHPWSLGELPPDLSAGTVIVAIVLADFHRDWPWTAARWQFVAQRMAELAPLRWHGDAAALGAALAGARSVGAITNPHLGRWLPGLATCRSAPRLFAPQDRLLRSFSEWWSRATRETGSIEELLGIDATQADLFR